MKVYLAARYSRRLEIAGYAEELRLRGIIVTSRWLDGSHQISDGAVPLGDTAEAAAALRVRFARDDYDDVRTADTLVAFTEPPRSSSSRGGRHVELGLALAWGKAVIVVGPRENLFHWWPGFRHCDDWPGALGLLVGDAPTLPTVDEMYGLAPDITGGLSVEAHMRRLRGDGGDDA